MIYKTFNIDTGNNSLTQKPTLTTYVLDNYKEVNPLRKRPMVFICPGGGYTRCSPREAEAVALKLNSFGYNAAVLIYSCSPQNAYFPESLKQVCLSMALLRKNADEFNTDPDRIAIMGFSAGGHLAASLGTMWHEKWLEKETGLNKEQYKPNALILAYPVISSGEFAHKGSIKNLLGDERLEKEKDSVSLENCVTSNVPRTFIWSTWTDETVPVENTLMFVNALRKNNVNTEVHIFNKGVHGLSTAEWEVAHSKRPVAVPEISVWTELLRNWLVDLWGTDFYMKGVAL